MGCYDSAEWQGNFYGSCNCSTLLKDLDDGSIDDEDFREEMIQLRDDYLACRLQCESSYCQEQCNKIYKAKALEIYNKYNN